MTPENFVPLLSEKDSVHKLLFAKCDVDECGDSNECDENSVCQNTPGSYLCQCNQGFADVGGPGQFLYRECNENENTKGLGRARS